MVQFTHIQTHLGSAGSFDIGISDIDVVNFGGVTYLLAISGADGGISSYSIDTQGPGAAVLEDEQSHGPATEFGIVPRRIDLIDLDGVPTVASFGGPAAGVLGYDLAPNNGALAAAQAITVGSVADGPATAMQAAVIGGATFLYAAHYLTGGLSTYEVVNGAPTLVDQQGGGGSAQSVDITDMARATVGAETYVFTTSTRLNSVSAYQLQADGTPLLTGTTGAANGLGVAAPSALVTASVAGTTYVVVAGAGSSSLSVMRLTSGGSLVPTDHILDGLDTRFQTVSALETVVAGGQTFILAGGADDGISLFSLLPDGRLLHRISVADTAATSLQNVSDIAATVSDGDLAVFASSETEAGISEFRVDLGSLGSLLPGAPGGGTSNGGPNNDLLAGQGAIDILSGGSGDDIIVDGAGSDILTGGSGADVFAMTADGQLDTITDYDPGQDVLDLSAWGLLYSVSQLGIQTTLTGATISFFSETLNITSHDATPLSAGEFSDASIVNIQRMPLWGVVVDQSLVGTPGNDTLIGANGDDTLAGGAGADLMDGAAGDDMVTFAGSAAGVWVDPQNPAFMKGDALGDVIMNVEVVHGSGFADQLRGDSTSNEFHGGAYSDRLYGRAGDDFLFGEGGADALYGNSGADTMTGGEGWVRDRFIYFTTMDLRVGTGLRDIITDFQTGKDRIEISRFDSDPTLAGNQAFEFVGSAAFSDVGQLRFEQMAGLDQTLVQADIDGDGQADFEIELTGQIDLVASDFLL